ncbi:hypothetical protein BT69DRAFT_1348594 [Atractiella rhizophila]|nr:hypothetical protein BT69DRAFT_1348594 [Atractiella rhizophila]
MIENFQTVEFESTIRPPNALRRPSEPQRVPLEAFPSPLTTHGSSSSLPPPARDPKPLLPAQVQTTLLVLAKPPSLSILHSNFTSTHPASPSCPLSPSPSLSLSLTYHHPRYRKGL